MRRSTHLIAPMLVVLGVAVVTTIASAQSPYLFLDNGNAEDGTASPDGHSVVAVPGWSTTGSFTVVPYGASGPFPSTPINTRSTPQQNFFCGGPTDTLSTATQTKLILGESTQFETVPGFWSLLVSATMGGWQSDQIGPRIRLTLLDAQQNPVAEHVLTHTNGTLTIFPTSALVEVYRRCDIPPDVRFIRITIELEGLPGQYNTSLVDDLVINFGWPDPVRSTTWSGVKQLTFMQTARVASR